MSRRIFPFDQKISRRAWLRLVAALAVGGAALKDLFLAGGTSAQAISSGFPAPDELVEATLKRLFGNRPLQAGDGKIKFELPLIAEDGGNVPIAVDANLPVSGPNRVSAIYVVSDKNRRP